MGELKTQTVSGVKWLVGSSFIQKVILIGTSAILARILNPYIFGVFSLAFIAIDSLSLFKSLGFDSALIRQKADKENIERAANTAFFIIPSLGVFLCLILFFSAPLIGKFLNNQDIVGVLKVMGVVFVISCFGKVPAALLEKSMQFKKITLIEISGAIVYAVTAVSFALSKAGLWSLVIAYIAKTIYQNTMFWFFSKWRPRLEFDKKVALEMFHFGKFLFLGSMVYFLRSNLDNLLVGKLLGAFVLGLYAIAFNIANFSADYFGGKVQRVIFPAYSKIQGNLYDLKAASLKVMKHIGIVAIPFGIGVLLLSEEILRLIYGEKWLGASGVLKILALAGIFNTLPAGMGAIFLACGRPKLSFWITTLQVVLFFIFIAPLAKLLGINGVGIVVSFSSLIAFIITLAWAMKILSINLKEIYQSLKPALISALLMAAGILLLKNLIAQLKFMVNPYGNTLLLSFSALAIYAFSLFKIDSKFIFDAKELLFARNKGEI